MFVLLLSLTPQESKAQQLQASLSHYTTDDGLPSNAIAALHNDDYGYVWIVTWNGVSRFDGYHFYNYQTGITSGIRGLHNRVDNLVIDLSQNVWLKMYDGRIFVINRQTDRIEDPMEGVSGHDEMHVDYFFTPYVTSHGDVLVSYDDVGLYKLRLDRSGKKQDLIMTGNLTVKCVVEGYHGDLWAGTNKGVHRIDLSNFSLEKDGYFLDEDITRLSTNGYNIFAGTKSGKIMQFSYGTEPTLVKDVGREITSLFIDSRGTLWFSDLGDGAYRLNPATGDTKFFTQKLPMPEFTSRGAEFGEAMGVVWVRLNHGGYGYYNRESDEVEYFHNDPVNPWNLSNTVNARLEMNDGVVWESTIRRGLEKLEVLKNTIERKLLVPESTSPLDNEVRGMCYDKKRHLTFLCNKNGAIFVFDAQGRHVHTITHDSQGNPIGRPYGMTVDSKGNYWVCDKDNGVFKITPTDGNYHVVNYRHVEGDMWSLSHNAAYQCVEDHAGNIWVATYGGGVNILRPNKSGGYLALHAQNVMKRYPSSTFQKVRTLTVAKDGKVWAGSTDGILIMSLKGDEVTVEQRQDPENLQDGLMSNDIVCLACDKQGTIWVGSNSGGLSHTVSQEPSGAWTFKNYGVADGLPSEEIRSITFDDKGNVWFAADHILCSFDSTKKIFTTFSQLDGVDETMCSESSAMVGEHGDILFGTMNGYYTIDRKKLKNATGSLLKLRITDFFLNEELQSPRLNDNFNYYVPEARHVTLPNNGFRFGFRFAALNYQLQHRVVYQYKLDGYDSDWRNADKTRTAMYDGVPAGTYRFHVKAFLLESPENYDIRTIEITVPPLFIFSGTAIWIYMLILAVGGLWLLWWYQKRLFKKYAPKAETDAADDDAAGESDEDDDAANQGDEEDDATDEYEIMQ